MKMINRIESIKDFYCFQDFKCGSALDDFKKYNLIWGWNGSGKTTLSKIFTYLEHKRNLDIGQCKIRIDDIFYDLNDSNLSSLPQVKVFNKEFIERNVDFIQTTMKPIFYLGVTNIENQKEIAALDVEMNLKIDEIHKKERDISELEIQLDEIYKDKAKHIKDTLRTNDNDKYSNYNKTHFETTFNLIKDSYEKYIFNDEKINILKNQINTSVKEIIEPIRATFYNIDNLADEVDIILQTNIISKTVSALSNDSNLSNWVQQGLNIHKDKYDNCQFCGQPISAERIKELEDHFSKEFVTFKNQIDELVRYLEDEIKKWTKISFPRKAEIYDEFHNEYDQQSFEIARQSKEYVAFIQNLVTKLVEKSSNLFGPISIGFLPKINIDYGIIEKFNNLILSTNNVSENFSNVKSENKKIIECSIVAQEVVKILKITSKLNDNSTTLNRLIEENRKLGERLDILKSLVVSHKIPADNINQYLKDYFGYDGIMLETLEGGYCLLRNGKKATNLSEGEKTAISLVYFLHSLEDMDFSIDKGIVVIDDPVSSLDSNGIFYVYGLIREKVEKCHQLFIFTHNYTFFREVKKWFEKEYEKTSSFYQIDTKVCDGNKVSFINNIDKILKKYDSEYKYLFNILYEASIGINTNLFYIYPNISRKVLESFYHFKKPNHSFKDCINESSNISDTKKRRILFFTNKYSHQDCFDRADYEQPNEQESLSTIKDVLQLIENEDKVHYNQMKSLCDNLLKNHKTPGKTEG
jgi:wobble nucleotide-excising tRNase